MHANAPPQRTKQRRTRKTKKKILEGSGSFRADGVAVAMFLLLICLHAKGSFVKSVSTLITTNITCTRDLVSPGQTVSIK